MGAPVRPDWIAIDWGTSHLRAYAMDGDGILLARARGPGMGALAAGEHGGDFEQALLGAVEGWLHSSPLPVLACGMVGSRQGWHEAGYLPVPHDLSRLNDDLAQVSVRDDRLKVWIVPGLSQANPFDVMRGEETQLAGYAAHASAMSDSAGGRSQRWICLPGTHAKWALLEGSRVAHFATAMTGEVFDLLTKHSILAHSVSDGPMDGEAFGDAVQESFHSPAKLTQALFGVRAEGLLAGEDGARARARVSGLLIGAELAALDLPAGSVVPLIGTPALCQAYAQALACLGRSANSHDGETMVLRGLSAIFAHMRQREETAS